VYLTDFGLTRKRADQGLTQTGTLLGTVFYMAPEQVEAADVDGASARQKLFLITLPMLRPIILFLTITGLMGTLNAFAEIYAMTDDTGGTSVNVAGVTLQSARISGYHLYKNFDQSMYGEAAAISFMLLLIALVISFLNYKVLSPRD